MLSTQRRSFDYPSQDYAFVRGEIGRDYQPLERAGRWTWLAEIPLGRESRVTLEVRAAEWARPVEHVVLRTR